MLQRYFIITILLGAICCNILCSQNICVKVASVRSGRPLDNAQILLDSAGNYEAVFFTDETGYATIPFDTLQDIRPTQLRIFETDFLEELISADSIRDGDTLLILLKPGYLRLPKLDLFTYRTVDPPLDMEGPLFSESERATIDSIRNGTFTISDSLHEPGAIPFDQLIPWLHSTIVIPDSVINRDIPGYMYIDFEIDSGGWVNNLHCTYSEPVLSTVYVMDAVARMPRILRQISYETGNAVEYPELPGHYVLFVELAIN